MQVFHKGIIKYQIQDALWYWIYIPVAVIGGGMLVDFVSGFSRFARRDTVAVVATFLIVGGTALIFRSIRDLEVIGYGTASPKAPPKRLVTEGIYAFCRHPMFLGYDLAAFGVLLLIGSPGAIFVTYPALIYFEVWFLKAEEQKLETRFGERFKDYKRTTPFLVPFTKRAGSRL